MSSLLYNSDKRRLLPKIERFEDYQEKRAIRGKASIKKINESIFQFKDDDLSIKLEEWKENKSKHLAGEILSHAIITEELSKVQEVKKYLEAENDVIIDWILNDKIQSKVIRDKIINNRAKLNYEPKDSLTWMDQAINYYEIGATEKSIRCLKSALTINKDSGFLIRNASRLYSLFGDNGRSIEILKKSEFYKYDPQILSAEIAFSQIEGRKTRGIDFGRNLLLNDNFSDFQNSELSGAIGTVEFYDGNFTKSEKLFDKALLDSSENSFAQSLWYKKNPIPLYKFEKYYNSNEIQAHRNAKNDNYEESLMYAEGWISDEKFSIRPYRTASHLKGVMLENYDEAFDIMKRGIFNQKIIKQKSDKNEEIGYLNDLAYFSLKDDNIKEAEKYVNQLTKIVNKKGMIGADEKEYVYLATLGLAAYKIGEIETGRKFYRRSIDFFKRAKKNYSAGSAFLNYFDEELEIPNNRDSLLKLRKELDVIINDKSESDLIFLKNRMINKFINYQG